jgi:hypothetical protein
MNWLALGVTPADLAVLGFVAAVAVGSTMLERRGVATGRAIVAAGVTAIAIVTVMSIARSTMSALSPTGPAVRGGALAIGAGVALVGALVARLRVTELGRRVALDVGVIVLAGAGLSFDARSLAVGAVAAAVGLAVVLGGLGRVVPVTELRLATGVLLVSTVVVWAAGARGGLDAIAPVAGPGLIAATLAPYLPVAASSRRVAGSTLHRG